MRVNLHGMIPPALVNLHGMIPQALVNLHGTIPPALAGAAGNNRVVGKRAMPADLAWEGAAVDYDNAGAATVREERRRAGLFFCVPARCQFSQRLVSKPIQECPPTDRYGKILV